VGNPRALLAAQIKIGARDPKFTSCAEYTYFAEALAGPSVGSGAMPERTGFKRRLGGLVRPLL
jgi:hypothetical protein